MAGFCGWSLVLSGFGIREGVGRFWRDDDFFWRWGEAVVTVPSVSLRRGSQQSLEVLDHRNVVIFDWVLSVEDRSSVARSSEVRPPHERGLLQRDHR